MEDHINVITNWQLQQSRSMQIYFQKKTEEPHSLCLGCVSLEFQINLTFITRSSNEKATRSFLCMSGIIFPASQHTHKTVMKIIGRRVRKCEASHGGQRSVACAPLSTQLDGTAWFCLFLGGIKKCSHCLTVLSSLSDHLSHRSKWDSLQDPSPTDSQQIPD